MYIVVTGAAGFIGSNIVKALNERGVKNIIAVDNLTKADKFGRGEQGNTLLKVRKELGERASVQVFSADAKTGVEEARGVVARLLEL